MTIRVWCLFSSLVHGKSHPTNIGEEQQAFFVFVCFGSIPLTSVGDPGPDPHVFGPPNPPNLLVRGMHLPPDPSLFS
jgi:hypothetical protein